MKEFNLEENTINTFDIIHNYFFQNKKRKDDLENCHIVFIKTRIYKFFKKFRNRTRVQLR